MALPRQPRHLFVYGSLMRGFGGALGWQKGLGARYAGPAAVKGRLYRVGPYPGAVFDSEAPGYVHGELYRLCRPEALAELDRYEGAGFARTLVYADREGGHPVIAWAYRLKRPAPVHHLIPGGDYRRR